VCIATAPNLITADGRRVILRFLASELRGMGEYMAFGIGSTAPTVDDKSLAFEYHRTDIDLKQPQFGQQRVVFRGTISDEQSFTVKEIGLYLDDDIIDEEITNTLITTFDPTDEVEWLVWNGSAYVQPDIHEGSMSNGSSFRIAAPANAARDLVRNATFGQFGGLQPTDEFAIAYQTLAGQGQVSVRFRKDASNYREYVFQTESGSQVRRWQRSQFIEVGTAGWDEFTSMQIAVSAGASGVDIALDGLRFDAVSSNDRPVLVSRAVLPQAIEKRPTSELQVEYVMNINFAAGA
jgi:hypothetical protein